MRNCNWCGEMYCKNRPFLYALEVQRSRHGVLQECPGKSQDYSPNANTLPCTLIVSLRIPRESDERFSLRDREPSLLFGCLQLTRGQGHSRSQIAVGEQLLV
jgi:hypothetical protein